MRLAGFTPTFLYLTGGLIVWAVRFLFVYAFAALACAHGWASATLAGFGVVPAMIVLTTVLGIVVCAVLLIAAGRGLRSASGQSSEENRNFVHAVAALAALTGILAMLWETAPILFVPVCAA